MHVLVALARSLCLLGWCAGSAGAVEVCQPSSPGYFHKYLAGKIDGKYAFTMDVRCTDGVLQGSYQYASRGVPISLQGEMRPGGRLTLTEFARDGSPGAGRFTGTLVATHVDGAWTAADGKRTLPFGADQTSEIHLGTRRTIMQAAVGTYGLDRIVGSGGANAMWETVKTRKGWESNVSSISMARRETDVVALTRADRRLLDSLVFRVRPDLASELVVNGKVILAIPFRDGAMQVAIAHPDTESAREAVTTLSAPTGIVDESLYLLAQDGVDYSQTLSGNFQGAAGDFVIVRYAIAQGAFALELKDGDCCFGDHSVFFFTRGASQQPAR